MEKVILLSYLSESLFDKRWAVAVETTTAVAEQPSAAAPTPVNYCVVLLFRMDLGCVKNSIINLLKGFV